MGQGRENARTFLKENKDVRDKLELALRKKLEIAIPVNSNFAEPAPNGHAPHAPHAQPEKPPVKTTAAAAGADACRGPPARKVFGHPQSKNEWWGVPFSLPHAPHAISSPSFLKPARPPQLPPSSSQETFRTLSLSTTIPSVQTGTAPTTNY